MVGVQHYADYSGTPLADWEITYGVDAFGRTVSRSETDNPGTEEATTTDENYVFDGANLALVLNDAGQVTERELYAPAVDAIMASEVVSPTSEGVGGGQDKGAVNWMLGDNQGSIRDVVQAGGVVEGAMTAELVDHVIFSAYGVPSQGAGFTSDALPRFGFNGMRRDAATGLFFAQYRPYDPRTGGWMQPDPSGLGPDTNPYRFVDNSPTNFTDPSGLCDSGCGDEDDPPDQVGIETPITARVSRPRFSR